MAPHAPLPGPGVTRCCARNRCNPRMNEVNHAAASSVKSVDALRRGLEVLTVIRQSSAITLADLHRQTGIAKATLLRTLKTLREAGWIERNELEGRYVPTAAPGDSGAAAPWRARLSAIAAPARATLQRRVPWPTDMAVRDGTAMLVLDAHRPINGLAVNYRVLGFRPRMLVSSLGRCYLAFCPEDERRALVAMLARSTRSPDRMALRPEAIQRLVAQGRAQGYSSRDPSETSLDSPERFGAISVPVLYEQRVIACLSCAWLPQVASEREIVATTLRPLQDAALAIAARARQAALVWPTV